MIYVYDEPRDLCIGDWVPPVPFMLYLPFGAQTRRLGLLGSCDKVGSEARDQSLKVTVVFCTISGFASRCFASKSFVLPSVALSTPVIDSAR